MDAPYSAWITVADIRADPSPGLVKVQTASDEEIQAGIDLATFNLFHATGERWPGSAEDSCWPCARRHGTVNPGNGAYRYPDVGITWWHWISTWGTCTCGLGPGCSCLFNERITLGAYPVISVDEVRIDGAIIDPATYRLSEDRWLERIDGDRWPTWQDVFVPVPLFVVEFTKGRLPPDAGRAAVRKYTAEIVKGALGDECELPSRVTAIVRQGTATSFASAADILDKGLTGVAIVDEWIINANGGKPRPPVPATIASPDIPRAVHHG